MIKEERSDVKGKADGCVLCAKMSVRDAFCTKPYRMHHVLSCVRNCHTDRRNTDSVSSGPTKKQNLKSIGWQN